MNRLEGTMVSLEYLLENRKKRHIMGGILLSTSLLFAGLALTIITMKHDVKGETNEQNIE